MLVLLIGLFIPMGWGAPSGPAAVIRNSVQVVPSVAGEVVDVPVAANTPVKAGDVLFRIDPTTYQAQHPFDPLELGGRQWAVKAAPVRSLTPAPAMEAPMSLSRSFADLAGHVAHATGEPITFTLCVVVELKCQRCWRTR
ncbi:hypothetical protein BB934_40390 (plasmid) [Microvirga ossetica]|uniref:Multidrug resistance protein MdtA-like barrel-sandwich hybrid domain-containing protein n=1 Tax=Microvirga ossetica TaxID=1882682 RepID=A0A1B2EWW0_9HYPH|nr:hypothetical protein BB934_40390 [Microvirga ossetica]